MIALDRDKDCRELWMDVVECFWSCEKGQLRIFIEQGWTVQLIYSKANESRPSLSGPVKSQEERECGST